MSISPLVSVIMNCRNGEKYLKSAIDSVYAQTFSSWEIIFWDNLSTDGSAAIAKSYDERLNYFFGESYLPLGVARNEAIKRARGVYIAFLDCDDLWMPQKLEKQVMLFERNPRLGLAYTNFINFDEYGNEKCMFKGEGLPRGQAFERFIENYFVGMSSAMIRADVAGTTGGYFDPVYEVCEEGELFYRIAYHYEIDYLSEPLMRYRVHTSITHDNIGRFAIENKMVLEKLARIIPDFAARYPGSVDFLNRKIAFQSAIAFWKDGMKKEARQALHPYMAYKKFMLLYAITFFPQSFYTYCYRIYHVFLKRLRL